MGLLKGKSREAHSSVQITKLQAGVCEPIHPSSLAAGGAGQFWPGVATLCSLWLERRRRRRNGIQNPAVGGLVH